jgi:pSer/pThr/pTyr-binding forkhead associated (FHA) protein
MSLQSKTLGTLRPLGGGDPVPFTKETLIVGRRPTCDICLDFDDVSGRHCEFRLLNGIWNVKDLGSSNGTKINGQKISSPTGVMPEVEIGIASHLFHLDYDPAGPASIVRDHGVLDEEIVETRKRTSLMEMAGLETDEKPERRRATRPPAKIERLSVDEAEFEDALPDHVKQAPVKKDEGPSDDDFFDLIKDEVK